MLALPRAESNYKDVDALTKTILAECYNNTQGKTEKARESAALCDKRYVEHLSCVSEARIEYLTAKATVEIEDKRHDTARSILSLEKAKIGIL
jgi:hypothetical protein